MKGIMNSLGLILFLALAVLGLVFYNVSYLPMQAKTVRLQQEIRMWTRRIEELTDSLKVLATGRDTIFSASFRFDELFTSPESLKVSAQGETVLRGIVSRLQGGRVEVIGHTDTERPPSGFRSKWDYSAAAAAAVCRRLISLGVRAESLLVVGAADTRPAVAKSDAAAQILNRRVEIAVRAR